MPEVELVGLHRLNVGGKVYEKGVKTPVDFAVAFALQNNPRFKVTGLDTREALDYHETQHRPPARTCSTPSTTPLIGSTSTTTRASIAPASRRSTRSPASSATRSPGRSATPP